MVLHCVWEQWRRLDVRVVAGPPGAPAEVRIVKGKRPRRRRGRRRGAGHDGDAPSSPSDELASEEIQVWKIVNRSDGSLPPGSSSSSSSAIADAPAASGDGGVIHDDLWMAFSIGLQWCTRFTRLVANAEQRQQLVGYMQRVQADAERAVAATLREVQVEDDDRGAADRPDDGPGGPAAAPRVAPAPAPAAPVRADALVVVGALVHAMCDAASDLHGLLRLALLAYAAVGRAPPAASGFRLCVRRVARRAVLDGPRVYQERLFAALPQAVVRRGARSVLLILENSPSIASWLWLELLEWADGRVALRQEGLQTASLDAVFEAFGYTSTAVRHVCRDAPGPRYAWPGYAAAIGGKRRRATAPAQQQLVSLTRGVV